MRERGGGAGAGSRSRGPEEEGIVCYEVAAGESVRFDSCGIRAPKEEPFVQRRRVMREYVAFLVVEGEIFLTDEMPTGEEHVRVGAGEVHIIAPGLHQSSTVPFARGIVFFWLHFTCPGPPLLLDTARARHCIAAQYQRSGRRSILPMWLVPRHLSLSAQRARFEEVHAELRHSARLWGPTDPGTQAICRYMVHALHTAFVGQTLAGHAHDAPGAAHVSRALDFIRLNYDKPISLADVARADKLNAAYLSRCFRRVTGQTVGAYIMRTKIEAAKGLLADPQYSVKQVAFLSGFRSASYFCRMFLRTTGLTPGRFREAGAESGVISDQRDTSLTGN